MKSLAACDTLSNAGEKNVHLHARIVRSMCASSSALKGKNPETNTYARKMLVGQRENTY